MVQFLTSDQSAQWRSYLSRLPPTVCDIHFHPEMMKPYEAADLGVGSLLVVERGKDFLIQPFLKAKNGVYRHPYNFGGPVATDKFGVTHVTFPSVCTLNPFLCGHQNQLLNGAAKYVKDSVWIDLTQPFNLRQTTRHTIEKANKAGVTVEPVKATSENIALFFNLYSKHMEKVGAAPHWKFPEIWFVHLLHNLGTMATLMFAKVKDTVIGACILIHEYGTCYYHFAAVSLKAPYGTSHRMVTGAAEHARDNGNKRFHLGGGIQPKDGLFTFKSGFSDLRLPVYKYECV